MREAVELDEMEVQWIGTKEMLADGLTKVLAGPALSDMKDKLHLVDVGPAPKLVAGAVADMVLSEPAGLQENLDLSEPTGVRLPLLNPLHESYPENSTDSSQQLAMGCGRTRCACGAIPSVCRMPGA